MSERENLRIAGIVRESIVDGPGMRFVVFVQGCPHHCPGCHNPQSHPFDGGSVHSVERIFQEICKNPMIRGVTFSGGEPLLQAEFLREMIPLLRERRIGYIVDTSGAVPLTDAVREVLAEAQSVILDLKFPTDGDYRRYTGRGIQSVLDTLRFLESIGKRTRIRTVIVPELNDHEETLEQYVEIIKQFSCVNRYELLAFHTMGFFKYERLGIENPLKDTPALAPRVLERLQKYVDGKLTAK